MLHGYLVRRWVSFASLFARDFANRYKMHVSAMHVACSCLRLLQCRQGVGWVILERDRNDVYAHGEGRTDDERDSEKIDFHPTLS